MKIHAALCGFLLAALPTAADPYTNALNAVMLGIEYAKGLQELGLPDYADLVITRAEKMAAAIPAKPKTLWERCSEPKPGLAHAGTNQLALWYAQLGEVDELIQEGRMGDADRLLSRVLDEMTTSPALAAVETNGDDARGERGRRATQHSELHTNETAKIDHLLRSVLVPGPEPPAPSPELRQVEVDHLWRAVARVEPPAKRRDPVTPGNRDECPIKFELMMATNNATAHFTFTFTEEHPVVVRGGRLELFQPDPDILFSPHAKEGRIRIPIDLGPRPKKLPATRRVSFSYPVRRLRNTYLRLLSPRGVEAISLEAFARDPDTHECPREEGSEDDEAIEINIQI